MNRFLYQIAVFTLLVVVSFGLILSFADGYTDAGLMATFDSYIQKLSVLGASNLIIAFLLVSGVANQQTSPTITSMTMNYSLIQSDPEFVLNHSTSAFHSKIELEHYQGNTWAYIWVFVEAPITVDNCTIVASAKSSAPMLSAEPFSV